MLACSSAVSLLACNKAGSPSVPACWSALVLALVGVVCKCKPICKQRMHAHLEIDLRVKEPKEPCAGDVGLEVAPVSEIENAAELMAVRREAFYMCAALLSLWMPVAGRLSTV